MKRVIIFLMVLALAGSAWAGAPAKPSPWKKDGTTISPKDSSSTVVIGNSNLVSLADCSTILTGYCFQIPDNTFWRFDATSGVVEIGGTEAIPEPDSLALMARRPGQLGGGEYVMVKPDGTTIQVQDNAGTLELVSIGAVGGGGYVARPDPLYKDSPCTLGQHTYSNDGLTRFDCTPIGWTAGTLADTLGLAPTPPTISSTAIGTNGTTWTLTASEALTAGVGGTGGMAGTCTTAGAVTLTYSSGNTTASLVYTGSPTVYSGDTCTLAYTQPTDGWEDAAGDELASFTGAAVTNGSTESGACSTPAGNELTESFASTPDNTWYTTSAGTDYTFGHTLAASAPEGSCETGLRWNSAGATSNRIWWDRGTGIDYTADSLTVTFPFYLDSAVIDQNANIIFLTIGEASSASNFAASVSVIEQSGGFNLRASAAVTSSFVSIALDTWYTVTIHLNSVAANSYLNVSGTQVAFTRNDRNYRYITIGSVSNQGAGEALDYQMGYINANTP